MTNIEHLVFILHACRDRRLTPQSAAKYLIALYKDKVIFFGASCFIAGLFAGLVLMLIKISL